MESELSRAHSRLESLLSTVLEPSAGGGLLSSPDAEEGLLSSPVHGLRAFCAGRAFQLSRCGLSQLSRAHSKLESLLSTVLELLATVLELLAGRAHSKLESFLSTVLELLAG